MAPTTQIPHVELSHGGAKMPVIGLGLAVNPPVAPEVTKTAALDAIELGYRHFDTACLYRTEEPLGEAISEALSHGLISSREELFITSKLWCSDCYPDRVLRALKTTLEKLKVDYLDLYLIHWPMSSKRDKWEYPIKADEFYAMDFKGVWAAMEECQRAGLTKAIGVSNYTIKKLTENLSYATIPPAVNQVEVSPGWQQKKLIDFCKEKGIVVTAYSPLGASGTYYGSNKIVDSIVLKEIAEAKGKTTAQVALRWLIERGITVVAKSFNRKRMTENLGIFGWGLTPEDHEKIRTIPQARANDGLDYTSEFGPFRTAEELWDGEDSVQS